LCITVSLANVLIIVCKNYISKTILNFFHTSKPGLGTEIKNTGIGTGTI